MNGTLMVLAVVTVAVVERGGVEEAMVEVAVMVMVMVITVVVEEAAEVANPSRMAAEVERKFVVGVASIAVVTFKIASIPPHACIPAISVSHLPDSVMDTFKHCNQTSLKPWCCLRTTHTVRLYHTRTPHT